VSVSRFHPSFHDNSLGRGGAHTSKGRDSGVHPSHYTVRGFRNDGHAQYTLHIHSEEEDATRYQNGGDWEAKRYLDIGKHCIDLRGSRN
jgi:hypothetical protein